MKRSTAFAVAAFLSAGVLPALAAAPVCVPLAQLASPPPLLQGMGHVPASFATTDRCPPGQVEQPSCRGVCTGPKGMPPFQRKPGQP